mmetsp:Transcript_4292/g.9260  ORF Transcript_4292/g.9260 Transcript_4292/m.9260 type:complete len:121 (-) Transcript_4292:468-830(-)
MRGSLLRPEAHARSKLASFHLAHALNIRTSPDGFWQIDFHVDEDDDDDDDQDDEEDEDVPTLVDDVSCMYLLYSCSSNGLNGSIHNGPSIGGRLLQRFIVCVSIRNRLRNRSYRAHARRR